VKFRLRGGRFGVYPAALAALSLSRFRRCRPDVVIDVHNGVPFFARLLAGCPVVVLVHHVHREQWSVVFGRRLARFGWWLESSVSPRLHRGCQYIAVSSVTRRELVDLGVNAGDISVVHNGSSNGDRPQVRRDPDPSLVVLGRLVPHKRVEHAMDVIAALQWEFPGLRLRVIGEGWWHGKLREHARAIGVDHLVSLEGYVSEQRKEELLARSWLMLAPSVKEGWGLMVIDAAAHGVPSIAYRDAGGLSESIIHGQTGLLVEGKQDLIEATRNLLRDHETREALGQAARSVAAGYSWRTASTSVLQLLCRVSAGLRPTDAVDPTSATTVIDLTQPQVSAAPPADLIDLRDDADSPGRRAPDTSP
jgi:glycosyltransferase involved in cell wall biosynthesis